MKNLNCFRMLLLLLLTLPAVVQAQWYDYTSNDPGGLGRNSTITITGYYGPGGAVVIPNTINGYSVTGIGYYAFASCTSLSAITVDGTTLFAGSGARGTVFAVNTNGTGFTNLHSFTTL